MSDAAALALALQASVPQAMRALPHWLLWRFEQYDGDKKPRKVPHYVSGRRRKGGQGGKDDLAELCSFDIAITHLAQGRYDGLGFAFLPGDGLIGIDIDNAVDLDTGEVQPRCQAIIDACASYTEFSPSGKGVHIIVAGQCDSFRENSIGLEVYSGRQFFTVTGRRWAGTPDQVAPIADGVLRRLQATKEQARRKGKPAAAAAPPPAAGPAVGNEFARVNAAALALLDVWVPSLFPQARKQSGTGAWRIKSKDLGRDLQEDLSLHRDGITDFGDEQGLTPIDVLVKFKGHTAVTAMRLLADVIGLVVSPKPARTPRGAAKASAEGTATPSPASGEGGAEEPPPIDDVPDDGQRSKPPVDPWREALLWDKGKLQDCRENIFHILSGHPLLKDLVALDQFSHRILKTSAPPWDSEPGEWTNNDDFELGLWLSTHMNLVVRGEGTLAAGVGMAAHRARFHPVKDWLTGLSWDGVDRLGHWLHECLGTTDTTYHRMVGSMFLMGLVARALQPGCQMDHMIVLEGGQGHGKSSALRVLAGVWFADTPIRIGDKDALLNLAGVMLYEVAELDSFNKAEVTAVKQYVSGRVDRVREPYTRRPVDRPRSCVLAGTTNQHEYFKDPTGSRRFWPVAIPGAIDLIRLGEWREQLFAEAVHRVQAGERHYPTRDEEREFFWPEQDQREIADPWFERVAIWLDAGEQELKDKFLGSEILAGALHVPADRIDGARNMATRVGVIMHRLGWNKRRDATGARLWRYVRPSKAATVVVGPDAGASGGPTPAWSAEDFAEAGDA
jgi:putative DNA primase/helicase